MNAPSPPVMILGCGRSGTSIFGELFDGLAGYSYQSEPAFADVVTADFATPRAFKVPRESQGYAAAPGLSFPLDVMLAAAPSMAFFWIVRHPLDTICSSRIGIEKNWGHHPRPPDWTAWLERSLLERCAHHWADLNTVGFAQVESIVTVVRFERMIAEPLAFAQQVCGGLGVSLADADDHLQRWAARVQDTNNAQFVEARTSRGYSRPDHARRIGRWRENLTEADLNAVWPTVREAAERFGYSVEAGSDQKACQGETLG
jgi:hypothetical protein